VRSTLLPPPRLLRSTETAVELEFVRIRVEPVRLAEATLPLRLAKSTETGPEEVVRIKVVPEREAEEMGAGRAARAWFT
jgi:hypothetical protein